MFHIEFDGRVEMIEDSPCGFTVSTENADLAMGVRQVIAQLLKKAGEKGPIICADGHAVIRGILEVISCRD